MPKTLSPFPLTAWLLSAQCKHIKYLDRLIALAVASFRNSKSLMCFPSHAKISKLTGFSRPTVQKATKRLSEQGVFIPILNGSHQSLHYFFTFDLTELNAIAQEKKLKYSELDEAMKLLPDALKRFSNTLEPVNLYVNTPPC